MDGLYGKPYFLKWMIWGYPYFWKHPYVWKKLEKVQLIKKHVVNMIFNQQII